MLNSSFVSRPGQVKQRQLLSPRHTWTTTILLSEELRCRLVPPSPSSFNWIIKAIDWLKSPLSSRLLWITFWWGSWGRQTNKTVRLLLHNHTGEASEETDHNHWSAIRSPSGWVIIKDRAAEGNLILDQHSSDVSVCSTEHTRPVLLSDQQRAWENQVCERPRYWESNEGDNCILN